MKRKLLIAAAVYFAILFAVPCYTIFRHHDILRTGDRYLMEVGAIDPYDPFRGRYVTISPLVSGLSRWGSNDGVRLVKGSDDIVTEALTGETANPGSPGYVKRLRIDRYYMNEKIAPLVEARQFEWREDDVFLLDIRVKNGNFAIEGLYINGVAAETIVTPAE
jgi:uncharacterized membrane-anchored protein